jgi:hypothetical protein
MKFKAFLSATVASALATGPAFGQAAPAPNSSDIENKIQVLQNELEKLKASQDQLRELQQELDIMKANEAAAAKDAADRERAARDAAELDARNEAERAAPILLAQNGPPSGPAATAATVPLTNFFSYKGVTITLGGFLAFETVYRSRSELGDIGSSFSAIPLPQSPFNHINEFRETARQSRVAFLAQGNPDPTTHLAMYGEFDFLAGPGSANSNESNSYSPRIRHLYGQADWDDLGIHILAGQNWSLLTLNAVGENPRTELPPPTIDAQYSAGYLWRRTPQFRIVKDFNKQLWFGVSFENPSTTVNTGLNGASIVSADHITFNGAPMAGLFSPNTVLSTNHFPEVIGKIAFDPDAAHQFHFEIMGMLRDFYDRANNTNHDTSAGSIGAGTFIKLIPGSLDIQATAMYGQGIGSYETSSLSDATLRPDGVLVPLTEHTELLGLTWHATPLWDFYVFGGEAVQLKKIYSVGATQYGYGNPAAVNTNCFIENSSGGCTANNKEVQQITVGTWDNVYSGSYGQLRIGLQYSYTKRTTFAGVGGAPAPDENMFFTSFRYYPF